MAVLREVTEERKSELRHLKLVPPLADKDLMAVVPQHQVAYPIPAVPAWQRKATPPRPVEVRFIATLASLTLAVATFGIVGMASHGPGGAQPRITLISVQRAAQVEHFDRGGFREHAFQALV
jgi:hypothetical protein